MVLAVALLPDSQTLTLFQLAVSGLGGDTTFNLPIPGPGPQRVMLEVRISHGPIEGALVFRVLARAGTATDSAEASLVIRDDGPPRLVLSATEIASPPTSLALAYEAHDAAGITTLTVALEGAVERDTTLTFAYAPDVAGTLTMWIPETARPGDSVVIRATVTDGFGKETADRRVVALADSAAPRLTVRIDTLHHSGLDETLFALAFFPGDTLRVHVAASDNHLLTWLGYRMLSFGDSVAPGSAADSVRFELEIPPGTNDPDAYIDVFAADSSGNRTEQRVYAVVMDGRLRPIETLSPYDAPLSQYDQQGDYVLDARRDVLYFTTFQNRVQVVSLSPLAEGPDIPFGASVRGVDLTPGGDSLVALVLGRPNVLVVWDIAQGLSSSDTIPVSLLGNCHAWDLQVAANGSALVTGWSTTTCPTVQVDLLTGAERVRSLPATLRNLAASGDRRTVVAWDQYDAAVYRSDTDSLGPVRRLFTSPTEELDHAGPSLDHAGAAVLIRNRLYDSALTSYRWLLPDPGYFPPARALSADGQVAFIGNWPGYWTVDVASGTVGEQVILPRFPWRMIAHPDGRRLIVFGWRWVGVVDVG
ncbi:MAG: hypothetical protein ACE5PT_01990 [Gemmatimonadales bacterium]